MSNPLKCPACGTGTLTTKIALSARLVFLEPFHLGQAIVNAFRGQLGSRMEETNLQVCQSCRAYSIYCDGKMWKMAGRTKAESIVDCPAGKSHRHYIVWSEIDYSR